MSGRSKDIELLARMAARLAGREPDEHLTIELAGIVPFDGAMWSYPDFLARAEAAYHALATPSLTLPPKLNDHERPGSTGLDLVGSDADDLPVSP